MTMTVVVLQSYLPFHEHFTVNPSVLQRIQLLSRLSFPLRVAVIYDYPFRYADQGTTLIVPQLCLITPHTHALPHSRSHAHIALSSHAFSVTMSSSRSVSLNFSQLFRRQNFVCLQPIGRLLVRLLVDKINK